MLRHVQNASSEDEAVDPSKEKDGRPAMIDRAPGVRLCRSSNLIETTRPGWKKGYVIPAWTERILISVSQQMIR